MADRFLHAPFPWFGGKSLAAPVIWEKLGAVTCYVEPFFGSGAVLLGRSSEPKQEIVNDKDGFLVNAWRAIKHAPEEVARHADQPVFESDLHARHAWLAPQRAELTARLEGDPDYFDAKIAGWWVWGQSNWIGHGWCSGKGPWRIVDKKLVRTGKGLGVERKHPELFWGRGVSRLGIKRQLPHLGNRGVGVSRVGATADLVTEWLCVLAARLRYVRVTCGDWSRTVKTANLWSGRDLVGVVLDPPYAAETGRDERCYVMEDLNVAHKVRAWAIEHGQNPHIRIALCGYDGEHTLPNGWEFVEWAANGGYGNQSRNQNRHRERIWFSPHCLASNGSTRAVQKIERKFVDVGIPGDVLTLG